MPIPYIAALIAALLLALSAPSAFAAPSPRDTVESAAKAIEEVYFDPAKGAEIARNLRTAAGRGEFDRFDDPRVLATELTRRLKPIDAHFAVDWKPEEPASAAQPAPAPALQPQPNARAIADRRANYGFKRVEILPGNLGYIDLRQFADFDFADDAAPARRAADAALALVDGADAVIIDLRNNGGGSPAMVGYLTSAFTPAGADIYNTFHFREGTASEAPEKPYARPDLDVRLYVLTSGRTGSAAEAFAYTLKNAKRAVIVGEASAGAANPGGTRRLPGGYAIFISGGSPRSPITGTNWEGTGVLPDIAAPSADALTAARMAALRELSRTLTGAERTEAEWALAELTDAPARPNALSAYAGDYSGLTVSSAGGGLRLVRGRRPALVLVPIAPDLFRDAADPARRVRFNRDAQGRVVSLEYLMPDGPAGLYRRGG